MIRLTTVNQKIQAVLDGAVTTNQLSCLVSYSDKNSAGYNGGMSLVATNNTTQVDICPAPAASTIRDIDYISVRNNDTAEAVLSLIYDDNGTDHIIKKVTLAVGDTLCYVHGSGWQVLTSAGSLKTGNSGGLTSVAWGDITGTLTDQTDLDTALDAKAASGANSDITELNAVTKGSIFGKNLIINGNFNIWQRGTSFVAWGSSTYGPDRWLFGNTSSAVFTASQSTDVPSVALCGSLLNYSLLLDCTTADVSIAAGDIIHISQYIEGYNWLRCAQKEFTFTFCVKATKTGIYCVSFRNNGSDRSYVAEYTVNASDTWEKKTIVVPASPSAGTWNYTNNVGIRVGFAIAGGSTWQTTANAWQTGSYLVTANQVNGADSTSNNFRIAGVDIKPGNVSTPLELEDYQTELLRCKRYTIRYNSDPSVYIPFQSNGMKYSTTGVIAFGPWEVELRGPPTISISAIGDIYGLDPGGNPVAASGTLATNNLTKYAGNIQFVTGSSLGGGAGDATSLLLGPGTGKYVEINAEL